MLPMLSQYFYAVVDILPDVMKICWLEVKSQRMFTACVDTDKSRHSDCQVIPRQMVRAGACLKAVSFLLKSSMAMTLRASGVICGPEPHHICRKTALIIFCMLRVPATL